MSRPSQSDVRDKNQGALQRVTEELPTGDWLSFYHVVLLRTVKYIPPTPFAAVLQECRDELLRERGMCPHCGRAGLPKSRSTRALEGRYCGFCCSDPEEPRTRAILRRMDMAATREAFSFVVLAKVSGAMPQIARVQG